jgi:polysaccharide pyruvyl transferase CsaB
MKVVIAGNYGAGNIGDEMILQGLLNLLKKSDPSAEITVLSGNPSQTTKKHKVAASPLFPSGIRSFLKSLFSKISKTKKLVKECDYFILGGGGLFGSLTLKANIIWGIQAFMAYRMNKPVLMYGQSIGELKGWFRKWIVKKVFNSASLIVVRDTASKSRLKVLSIKQKIHVIPDLAFNIPFKRKKSKRKPQLILALRQNPQINPKFIKIISEFLNWVINKHNWKIKIINFQNPPSPDADKIIHQKIIKNKKNISTFEYKNSKQLLNEFSKSSLVLGMRLHSIISAIITKTPFIAIAYAPKVEALLKDEKMEKYMLKLNEITLPKLKSLFKEVVGD